MNANRKRLLIACLVAVILVALAAVTIMNATKQPTAADYKSLDIQRQIVDTSMNIYRPVFAEFSTDYGNVYAEERSKDDKSILKTRYVNTLDNERMVNSDRLQRMESSVALKEPSVKSAYERYAKAYDGVIDYYDRHTTNIAGITESVSGPCAVLSKLNVSSEGYAAEYTKSANACLSALSAAKKSSDGTTKKLLTDVEKLIKERRDKFNEVAGKEEFEQNIARINALLSLLDINSELKVIQTEYETTTKTQYTKLVNEANDANAAFDKALDKFVTDDSKKGNEA